jgi:hypothetical protein
MLHMQFFLLIRLRECTSQGEMKQFDGVDATYLWHIPLFLSRISLLTVVMPFFHYPCTSNAPPSLYPSHGLSLDVPPQLQPLASGLGILEDLSSHALPPLLFASFIVCSSPWFLLGGQKISYRHGLTVVELRSYVPHFVEPRGEETEVMGLGQW